MRSLAFLPFGLFILFSCENKVLAKIEITSISVTNKDDKFAIIERDQLLAVNRSLKVYNLHIKMLQLPITNFKVNYAILKRSNGYLPFHQNYTLDCCKFFLGSKHLLNRYIYSFYKDYTNYNHTCPYNHDLILENYPTHSFRTIDILPIPKGEYGIDTVWYSDGKARFEGKVRFTFS